MQIFYLLGKIHTKLGEFTQALTHFNTALKNEPKHFECLRARAICYGLLGSPDQALIDLNTCLKQNPSEIPSIEVLIRILYQKGDWNRIDAAIKHFLEVNPEKGAAHIFLIEFYLTCEKIELALIHLEHALKYCEEDKLLFFRAHISFRQERHADAVQALKRLLEINPTMIQGLVLYAEILNTYFFNAEALDYIEKALDLDPANIKASQIRANIYRKLGRKEKAFHGLSALLEKKPNDTYALNLKAEILSSKNVDSFEELKKSLSSNPTRAALMGRANFFYCRGNFLQMYCDLKGSEKAPSLKISWQTRKEIYYIYHGFPIDEEMEKCEKPIFESAVNQDIFSRSSEIPSPLFYLCNGVFNQ